MDAYGWEVTTVGGIDNLGGQYACQSDMFHAYSNGNDVGTASVVLSGSGTATLIYGNCWNAGVTNVYLNGVQLGSAAPETNSQELNFDFVNGDLLEVKDEEGNAVMSIASLTICQGKCWLLCHLLFLLHVCSIGSTTGPKCFLEGY